MAVVCQRSTWGCLTLIAGSAGIVNYLLISLWLRCSYYRWGSCSAVCYLKCGDSVRCQKPWLLQGIKAVSFVRGFVRPTRNELIWESLTQKRATKLKLILFQMTLLNRKSNQNSDPNHNTTAEDKQKWSRRPASWVSSLSLSNHSPPTAAPFWRFRNFDRYRV